MFGSSPVVVDPSAGGIKGGEGEQGWISAMKVSRLGCFFVFWFVLFCLTTVKVVSSVREGGEEVNISGEVKGQSCP